MLISDAKLSQLVFRHVAEFDPSAIGHASLDIHLARYAQVEDEEAPAAIQMVDLSLGQGMQMKVVDLESSFMLTPGQFLLAESQESFEIPDDVVGVFTLRSRYARNGLGQTASLMLQPGWKGRLALELTNRSRRHTIMLKAGDAIGQIHFFRSES